MQRFEPREKRSIQPDGVGVGGEPGRHVLLDLAERVVGVGASEAGKRAVDAAEELARTLQCDHGVVEGRFFGVGGDGVDFLELHGHAKFKGRRKVPVCDPVERRVLVGE